jgi:hypothetical protein
MASLEKPRETMNMIIAAYSLCDLVSDQNFPLLLSCRLSNAEDLANTVSAKRVKLPFELNLPRR